GRCRRIRCVRGRGDAWSGERGVRVRSAVLDDQRDRGDRRAARAAGADPARRYRADADRDDGAGGRVSEVRRIEDAEVGRLLREQIDDHNIRITGIAEWHPITFVVDDEHGEIVAGVDGWEWGGSCFVNALWVREDRRGDGLGSALMDAMEEAARDLGCRQMVLETHSFQAPA